MKKKWIVGLLVAASASVSMAEVALQFNQDYVALGGTTNRVNASIGSAFVYDFTIGATGIISLDASTADTNYTIQTRVNYADTNNCGSTAIASLFNTTFQITVIAIASNGTPGILTTAAADGSDMGALGIVGNNSGRIDGFTGYAAREHLVLALTSGAPDLTLNVLSFDWNGNMNTVGLCDYAISNGVRGVVGYDLPSNYGTVDLSGEGMVLGTSTVLDFTTPANLTHGYALAGVKFDVVPEPSTIGMIGIGAISAWMIRRFRKYNR